MIVGITATRKGLSGAQDVQARAALVTMGVLRLHHGDCAGGDEAMHVAARKFGIAVEIHPPNNPVLRAHCKALPGEKVWPEKPYTDRNRDIVDAVAFLLAMPENELGEYRRSGTWSTVRYARRVGRPGIIVRPSGRVESLLDPSGSPATFPAPCSTCGAVVTHAHHADPCPAWKPVPHWAPCGAWCFEGDGEATKTHAAMRMSHRQIACGTLGCEGGRAPRKTGANP